MSLKPTISYGYPSVSMEIHWSNEFFCCHTRTTEVSRSAPSVQLPTDDTIEEPHDDMLLTDWRLKVQWAYHIFRGLNCKWSLRNEIAIRKLGAAFAYNRARTWKEFLLLSTAFRTSCWAVSCSWTRNWHQEQSKNLISPAESTLKNMKFCLSAKKLMTIELWSAWGIIHINYL